MKNFIVGILVLSVGFIAFLGSTVLSTLAKASTRSSVHAPLNQIENHTGKVKHVEVKLKNGTLKYTIMPNSDFSVSMVIDNDAGPGNPISIVDYNGFHINYDPKLERLFMRNSAPVTYYVTDSFWGNTSAIGNYSLINYPDSRTNVQPATVVTNQYLYFSPTGLSNAAYNVNSVNAHMYIQDVTITANSNGSFYRCDGNVQRLWQPSMTTSVEGILMACDNEHIQPHASKKATKHKRWYKGL